jgi:ArsR family transcriptional regulator, arsenate/arsenite/antimonite-responsive transcriptional repressor
MEISSAIEALGSLAQESRLRVFRLLVNTGAEGIAAGEIAERLDVPQATLSFHLNHLRNAGLIESRREGRSIIYALKVDGIRDLMSFLTEECCQGNVELCMPVKNETNCRLSENC